MHLRIGRTFFPQNTDIMGLFQALINGHKQLDDVSIEELEELYCQYPYYQKLAEWIEEKTGEKPAETLHLMHLSPFEAPNLHHVVDMANLEQTVESKQSLVLKHSPATPEELTSVVLDPLESEEDFPDVSLIGQIDHEAVEADIFRDLASIDDQLELGILDHQYDVEDSKEDLEADQITDVEVVTSITSSLDVENDSQATIAKSLSEATEHEASLDGTMKLSSTNEDSINKENKNKAINIIEEELEHIEEDVNQNEEAYETVLEPHIDMEVPEIDAPTTKVTALEEVDGLIMKPKSIIGKKSKKKRNKAEKARKKQQQKEEDGEEMYVLVSDTDVQDEKSVDDRRKNKKDKSKKIRKKTKAKAKKVKKSKSKKSVGERYAEAEPDSYSAWLLSQNQISAKGKKRKKQSKVIAKAMRSTEKQSQVVSEPLAQLLAAQGHTNQAILMYQELILIYPEKSAFFAAQIDLLKNTK